MSPREQLRRKYEVMRRLRAPGAAVAPREQLRLLAADFPGALRQLDQLPPAELKRRWSALRTPSDAHEVPLPAWAELELAYHRVLRACLRVRKRVALVKQEGGSTDQGDLLPWVQSDPGIREDEPEPDWVVNRLAQILAPPSGRLNAWVLEEVAARFALSSAEAAALLFPAPASCSASDG